MQAVLQPGGLSFQFNREDLGHLNDALNEVCNGFEVANFEAAIGLSHEQAAALLQRVHGAGSLQKLNLSLPELDAIRNAITAVLAELDASEYATRMGFEVAESEAFRKRLDLFASEARYGHIRQTA